MKDQKGFSPVYAILIVVIVGMIGFTGWYVYHSAQNNTKTLDSVSDSTPATTKLVSTPTPSEISTWKSFSNSTYGYSLKYPNDWNLEADHNLDPSTAGRISLMSPRSNNNDALNAYLFIETYDLNNIAQGWKPGQSLKDFYSWQTSGDSATKTKTINYTEQTINGINIIKRETVQGPSYYNFGTPGIAYYYVDTRYYFVNNNHPFTITYHERTYNEANTAPTAQNSSNWVYKDTVNKIINSLKFN